jgi:hypothetical protein
VIPGLVLLSLSGLMLRRGFTGQSPVEEVRKLLAGEAIFVRDGSSSLVGSPSGTGPVTSPNTPGGNPPLPGGSGSGRPDRPI